MEALKDLARRQRLGARGSELDRERKPVQALADLLGQVYVDAQMGRDGVRAGDQQLNRVSWLEAPSR